MAPTAGYWQEILSSVRTHFALLHGTHRGLFANVLILKVMLVISACKLYQGFAVEAFVSSI